ncbi:MAG: YgjV family protein [Lachnospiraceae bacterium]|nr:YgjV family protein [Lachnospiraceae bacterium]
MESLIMGNLCSLAAMITDSISSSRKTAKGVLFVQTISQLFYLIGSVMLKGYSAAVQNAVSIFRNIAAIKEVDSRIVEWTFIIAGVVLGVVFNNRGALGWLPIIGNLEYSIAVFRFKDNEWALKFAFLITVILFTIFNVVILNFVGVVSNIIVVVATSIFLIKTKK